MSVRLYADVHVRVAVTEGLRLRGVDILTAQEDGATQLRDPELLTRASERGRVLFYAGRRSARRSDAMAKAGESFSGLVYAHQLNVTIGGIIADLELIAGVTDLDEWKSVVVFLPLR